MICVISELSQPGVADASNLWQTHFRARAAECNGTQAPEHAHGEQSSGARSKVQRLFEIATAARRAYIIGASFVAAGPCWGNGDGLLRHGHLVGRSRLLPSLQFLENPERPQARGRLEHRHDLGVKDVD